MSYKISEQTIWAVEAGGVVLLNPATGLVRRLAYPQAAVWELLAGGHDPARALAMLAAMVGLDSDQAGQLWRETLEDLAQGRVRAGGRAGAWLTSA